MENETFFWDGHTKGARELAETLFAEHRIPNRKIFLISTSVSWYTTLMKKDGFRETVFGGKT